MEKMEVPQIKKHKNTDVIVIDASNESGTFTINYSFNKLKIISVYFNAIYALPLVFLVEPSVPLFLFAGNAADVVAGTDGSSHANTPHNTITFTKVIPAGTTLNYKIGDASTTGLATASGLTGTLTFLAEFIEEY